jgi:hypothetical protein
MTVILSEVWRAFATNAVEEPAVAFAFAFASAVAVALL